MPDIPRLKAEFFKTLGHPVRVRALELLSNGQRTVSELQAELAVEQAYLSQQLAVLRRGGFVVSRREGSAVVYALADPRAVELLALARQMLLDMATETRDLLRQS